MLIFTEFVPTQVMLADFLERRGFTVVSLNGAMDLEERRQAQRRFATDAQILISTDAGGEGLNLQFCHVIVNYDLPWNPMKIEQRIGRVDRIGQNHIVRAMNFALADTVELRVREVLEEKLARILEEFGVDKLADVLDSEDGGVPFEALFAQAMIAPEDAEQRAAGVADEIRRRAEEARASTRLLSATERLDPSVAQKIANHQMPYWTEQMTLGYLRSQESAGASVKPAAIGYDIRWPNGETFLAAVFSRDDADRPGATMVSLEDERVRGLTISLPVFAPGQAIPSVAFPDVSDKTSGFWSLWRISLHTVGGREQRFLAIFLTEDGRIFGPTARMIWERLIGIPNGLSQSGEKISGPAAIDAFDASRKAAEAQGTAVFEELAAAHQMGIMRERKKGAHAFSSRRCAIERLGLATSSGSPPSDFGRRRAAMVPRACFAGSWAPRSRRRPHGSGSANGRQPMSGSSPSGTWREPILAQFSRDIASVARLTVVADPDGLLTEQGIVDGVRQRGFEIVPFEDHVAFRYAYERRFRDVWDHGNNTNLVVVLQATRSDISRSSLRPASAGGT